MAIFVYSGVVLFCGLLALGGWFGGVIVGGLVVIGVGRTLEREKAIEKLKFNLRVPLRILKKETYFAI